MQGFSYINKVTSATVHLSEASQFDESDKDQIEKFADFGHCVVRVDLDGDNTDYMLLDILDQLGAPSKNTHLINARIVDALVGAADTYSGLLVVIIASDLARGYFSVRVLEFIEYFLVASDAWREAGKPYHVVFCDSSDGLAA